MHQGVSQGGALWPTLAQQTLRALKLSTDAPVIELYGAILVRAEGQSVWLSHNDAGASERHSSLHEQQRCCGRGVIAFSFVCLSANPLVAFARDDRVVRFASSTETPRSHHSFFFETMKAVTGSGKTMAFALRPVLVNIYATS